MKLKLKWIPTTHIPSLAADVCDQPYQQAFPSALSDLWVTCLARDLRQVDIAVATRIENGPAAAGPLMVALQVMAGRRKERGHDSLIFSDAQLSRCFGLYQCFLERELVSRLLGVPALEGDAALVAAIDSVIDSEPVVRD